MSHRPFVLWPALCLLLVGCPKAPQPTSSTDETGDTDNVQVEVQDLQAEMQAVHADAELPAVGGAIIGRDGAVAVGVAGERAQGGGSSVHAEDAWHLGSDTKAMTATLAGQLVEEGVLEWQTTVGEVWPDAHPDWRGVTALELMHHTSGASGNLIAEHRGLWDASGQAPSGFEGRADLVEALIALELDNPKGSFVYSNAGYIVLGRMLEVKTDTPWTELMRSYLFEPLGMDSCGFGPPPSPAPQGHRGAPGSWSPVGRGAGADNPAALGPAGTVHCSLADWGDFIALHLRAGEPPSAGLTADSFEVLHTAEGGYAGGWAIGAQPWAEGPVLTHSGSNTMWFATAWLDPASGRAYLAVSNAGGTPASAGTNAVIVELLKIDGRL